MMWLFSFKSVMTNPVNIFVDRLIRNCNKYEGEIKFDFL